MVAVIVSGEISTPSSVKLPLSASAKKSWYVTGAAACWLALTTSTSATARPNSSTQPKVCLPARPVGGLPLLPPLPELFDSLPSRSFEEDFAFLSPSSLRFRGRSGEESAIISSQDPPERRLARREPGS